MAWRVANSLVTLRNQINASYPNRNKASDGTIGDPNHQAEGSGSDHNPNRAGVVCAFDVTHDPAKGVGIVKLAQSLADSRDSRIKYLIRNSQIMVPSDSGWTWQPYSGSNPHTSHLHISVWGDYDNTTNWKIGDAMSQTLTNKNHLKVLFRQFINRDPTPAETKDYVGKPYDYALNKLDKAKKDLGAVIKERDALKKQSSVKATKLKPGLYEV